VSMDMCVCALVWLVLYLILSVMLVWLHVIYQVLYFLSIGNQYYASLCSEHSYRPVSMDWWDALVLTVMKCSEEKGSTGPPRRTQNAITVEDKKCRRRQFEKTSGGVLASKSCDVRYTFKIFYSYVLTRFCCSQPVLMQYN